MTLRDRRERLMNCATLPAELRSKQNAKWKAEGALSELVDNGFGLGRGDASEVAIIYDKKASTLTVIDNGVGMDHIGSLFQGGNTSGPAKGDIGEYGAGGTKAILWLATHVDIATLRNGKVMRDAVSWAEWIAQKSFKDCNVSDEWLTATISNTPPVLLTVGHGTVITMKLARKRRIDPAKIRRELETTYSPGLRNGKRIIWQSMSDGEVTDEHVLTAAITKLAPSADTVRFDVEMVHDVDNVVLPFKGEVSYNDKTAQADSKIHIGFAHRIIQSTTECFRSADSDEHYAGVGVSGWIDLGDAWRPYLSVTKDEIDDEAMRLQLMEYIFKQIKSLLEKSQRKMFSMEFEDLAIGLETALNQRTGGNITFLVKPAPFPGDLPEPTGIEGGNETGKREHEPGDHPQKTEAPPLLRIEIRPLEDALMKGHLCRSDINRDLITVYVNEEHDIVIEALKARPVNKKLLNMLIIGELGNVLAGDNYEAFIGRMFKTPAARAIQNIDDERDRARTVIRELTDRVVGPPIEEEEPDTKH